MNIYMYIFVEGATDNLFITKLFAEKLSLFGDNYNIIEYSKQKNKKINNYINSIKSTSIMDYIFISDQDGNKNRKQDRLNEYPNLECEKLFISIYEIESWIIAGISQKIIKKYKLKALGQDTSTITKEIFDNIIPKRMNKIDFISIILDDYDIEQAIKLNSSLKSLYEYLNAKKAS